MIHYLVTRAHAYTIRHYLEEWNRRALSNVQVEFYDALPARRRAARGTWIFSDLERLPDAELRVAGAFHRQLVAAGVRTLNDPARVIRRYDLLKLMHDRGINRFRAYRLSENIPPLTFPVFLRRENEHHGSLTPLLKDQAELDAAIAQVRSGPLDPHDVLVVEYCHTANGDGLFRKYSAMRVGDRFIPRHVLFTEGWVCKQPTLSDAEKVQEESEYLSADPHAAALREIFDLAHIEYGRIDYGLLHGQLQVWEINTNPTILPAPETTAPERLPNQARSAARIAEALDAIDSEDWGEVAVRYDRELLQGMGWGLREEMLAAAARSAHAVGRVAMVRRIVESFRRMSAN